MNEAGESMPEKEATGAGAGGGVRAARAELALQLKGRLPCARCGYNLGGLSISGVCPECGMPIRATLLVVVDPHARELQTLRHPRLVAAGLLLWAVGALGAALLGWWAHVVPLMEAFAGWRWSIGWARMGELGGIVVSGIGAVALVRPHARIPRGRVGGAALGVVGTFVFAGLTYWNWTRLEAAGPMPMVAGAGPRVETVLAMLAQAGVLVLVIVGLRPNARLLEARSLVLRSGRVDRQTMVALAAAVGVVAAGHVVNLGPIFLGGRALEVALSAGRVLVAVGWMLFTIGLMGVLLDVVRLCPVLLEPSPTLGSLLEEGGLARGGLGNGRPVVEGRGEEG